jgi:predicted AAA+ superfamily ATPase
VISDPAARFENLVGSHLLKWANFLTDTQGHAIELRYFRDIDGREVDFVLTHDGRAIGFIECKWADAEVSPALRYLKQRFPDVPTWQLSAVGTKDFETAEGIRVAPASVLLSQLV